MDDNTYAEVGVIHKEKFDIAENNCYATVNSLSVTSKEGSTHQGKKATSIIVVFICMTIFILGTVSACAIFALEINKLKSGTASLIKDSVQELNTSLYNMLHQQVCHLTNDRFQQLNNTLNSEFTTKVQNFNTSIDTFYQRVSQQLENNTRKLFDISDNLVQVHSELENNTRKLFDISGNLVQVGQDYFALENNTRKLFDISSNLAQHTSLTISSCAALPRSFPSGHYWVGDSIDSAKHVYCDMSEPCGGVSGWTKVAELDMTNSSHHCPSGLGQRNYSSKRTCVRALESSGCSSVTFSTNAVRYNKVCGRVIAYQYGSPDGFFSSRSIDSIYVDGIAFTHGNPKQHMWTFAAVYDEFGVGCPCINDQTPYLISPPSFVGNDYFCDTGSENHFTIRFYGDDPLWDGAGCGPHNRCCTFNNPPWFYKQLSQDTTDDIEMRVCRNDVNGNEDIAIEIVEIYIQ